jgi:hypothetical protein
VPTPTGIKVYGATLTPVPGHDLPGLLQRGGRAEPPGREPLIRTSGAFDAVIDFEKVVRDPADPSRMLPAYDVGDHLHPNDAGYRAMAESIDLRLFDDDDGDHDHHGLLGAGQGAPRLAGQPALTRPLTDPRPRVGPQRATTTQIAPAAHRDIGDRPRRR